jgi:hypothetical protein
MIRTRIRRPIDQTQRKRKGGVVVIIQANQIRPGDIVEYHGVRHLVSEVRRQHGAAWPVACDAAGWAIALGTQPLLVRSAKRDELLAAA